MMEYKIKILLYDIMVGIDSDILFISFTTYRHFYFLKNSGSTSKAEVAALDH